MSALIIIALVCFAVSTVWLCATRSFAVALIAAGLFFELLAKQGLHIGG